MIGVDLSMIQSDLFYTTDQRLNRHPCNCITLLSSLRQEIALFGGSSRDVSQIGLH
jgi:hypothetical protein